jgi:hypothetical protein
MCTTAFSPPDLASFQWKNRLLVLLAPSANDTELKKQQAIASEVTAGFSARDLILLAETRPAGPLHRKFGVMGGDFRVLLIGKDGHTALERSNVVSSQELFSVIDAMPMRRDEIRQRMKSSIKVRN